MIVGQTSDETQQNIAGAADYLKSVNLDVSRLPFRGKWIFVWQQGAYEKTQSLLDNGNVVFSKQFVISNTAIHLNKTFYRQNIERNDNAVSMSEFLRNKKQEINEGTFLPGSFLCDPNCGTVE
ncbi:hypothetical protein HELRODRAFT_180189 [Helobdella robusta]|uniref:ILEI/PANDER domain-containing protein n=1 Tax=Helobdella robusta TaxID=6412 RepID=T1FFK2_HELRO|nr:hypothetical protein HELRODRAFT_180189 [Helobdella robusta]ESN94032.1 hypothetical protein HELRODRAFT_180189 [Helobdella robusta]